MMENYGDPYKIFVCILRISFIAIYDVSLIILFYKMSVSLVEG